MLMSPKEPADTKESVDANDQKEPVDAKRININRNNCREKANYMFVSPYGYRTAKFEDGTVGYIAAIRAPEYRRTYWRKKYS